MTTVNWADIIADAGKGNAFELLPDGTYTVVVFKAEAVTAKSGNPMINVTYKVAEGPHANRHLYNRHVVTDKAYGMFIGALKAYGITTDWLSETKPDLSEVATRIIGQYVSVNVIKSHYQGKEKNEVKGLPRPAEVPQDGIPTFGASDPSSLPLPATPPGISDVPMIPGGDAF